MTKILISTILFGDILNSYSQTNSFPDNGNVGIGTKETEGYKLAVAGTTGIIVEKVTVKLYDN